jgi:hypothetical protein
MTCDETRQQLAEYVSGTMPEVDRVRIASHLADCPACRHECESLRGVCRLIDHSPAPTVQVDVTALYEQIAQRERSRARRWRRTALATALAAGVLLLLGLIPLLRWLNAPAPRVDPPVIVRQVAPSANDERLQRLEELTQALLLDIQTLQVKQQGEQIQLANQLARLREDVVRMRAVTDEDVTTLTRHIDTILKGKGDNP